MADAVASTLLSLAKGAMTPCGDGLLHVMAVGAVTLATAFPHRFQAGPSGVSVARQILPASGRHCSCGEGAQGRATCRTCPGQKPSEVVSVNRSF